MAALAKILGVLCMLAAAVVGLVAMMALFWPTTQQTMVTDEAAGEAFLIAVGFGSFSLLLATVGAAAYVIGDLGDDAAARRQIRAAKARAKVEERPYGASTRT